MVNYHITFKHIIGKSTFKQGFTVPKRIYSSLSLPEKGHHREIQLLFETDQIVCAKLYRINNNVGHLQVRYEGQQGEKFRNWLLEIFSKSWNNPKTNINEYFEVIIVDDNIFEIKPFPLNDNTLYLEDIVTHKIDDGRLFNDERFIEIVDVIRIIPFITNGRQEHYNNEIKQHLIEKAWLYEQKVVNDKRIHLKCDFRKSDMQLEIEFGNARTYYQDLIKFAMSYNAGIVKFGGLLVPSSKFSKYLCHLGHLNALQKSHGKKSQYSGMMDFNKAAIEFDYIKAIFNIPFFILSINYPC